MKVKLLNRKNEVIRDYPDNLALILERKPRSDEAINAMDKLHREQCRLMCGCGRVLHVVQKEYPFLRRNPGQEIGMECRLCESSQYQHIHSEGAVTARNEKQDIGFILATKNHGKGRDDYEKPVLDGSLPQSKSVSSRSTKYAKAFGVFFSIMEKSGYTSLNQSIRWVDAWNRIYHQLSCVRLHEYSRNTLADYCWLPGGFYKGGLKGMNDRLLKWNHPNVQPEGWLFGITFDVPDSEEIEIHQLSRVMINKRMVENTPIPTPYTFQVPKHAVAVIGRNGPYLALAVASANKDKSYIYRKPIFHRLLLQSIVDEHNPVPVESSYERETVLMLQQFGMPFNKPVFNDADGLRPDFILPNHKILIEVQGMVSDEYRERKKEIHERLLKSKLYDGYKLLKYEPNNGESIEQFKRKLRSVR